MNKPLIFLPIIALLHIQVALTADQSSLELVELWSIEGQFADPESAVFDPISGSVFVSNVNGYAKDGNGFISRVDQTGENLQLQWMSGLNSPTGLTIAEGFLYAVDYDQLLKIDIATTSIVARFRASDPKPILNDVVVSSQDEIFVTGSGSSTIYQVRDNELTPWLKDEDQLKFANGLFIQDRTLFVGASNWSAYNLDTKARIKIEQPNLIDADGITDDGQGGLIITLVDDDHPWHLSNEGIVARMDKPINGIDLSRNQSRLFIPRIGNTLSGYVFQIDEAK